MQIEKTYAELTDFNYAAVAYLKKKGILDEQTAVLTKKEERDKLDLALMDILMKQIGKKIDKAKNKKIEEIQIKNAAVDTVKKTLLVLDKGVSSHGIPPTYEYTTEGRLQMKKELEELEEVKVTVNCRFVAEADMPKLTPEELEAFGEYVIEKK